MGCQNDATSICRSSGCILKNPTFRRWILRPNSMSLILMIELPRLYRRIALYGLLLTPMLTAFASGQTPNVASKKIAQEARSILSNRCFACHGPDEAQVEAGLRLDDRTRSLALLDSGKRAIVPGKPSDSELMRRIASHDDSERMPPPKFADRLSEREQRILDTG